MLQPKLIWKQAFSLSFLLLCLLLAGWQVLKGLQKYFSYPQGASLTLEKLSDRILPEVTICPGDITFNMNTTAINACNLTKYRWTSDKCPDPELNYQAVYLNDPKELLYSMMYMNGTCHPQACFFVNRFRLFPQQAPRIIHHAKELSCFTYVLPAKSIEESGITRLTTSFKKTAFIKIHTPGMFLTEVKYLKVDNVMIEGDINYEVITQLNTDENPCNADPDYRRDDCVVEKIHDKSMETWGCSTPFGINKSHICTSEDKMEEAIKYHDLRLLDNDLTGECLLPCTTIIPTLSIRSKDDVGFALLTLEFPSRIKVVEAYPAYIFLSLVAEVGGYVGLFLGVSLLDFRGVVIAGVEKISAQFQ